MVRIKNFDKFINRKSIGFYSEDGITTKLFDKSTLTSDEIDAVIEEYCACKAHIALIISFDIPGKASATMNINIKDSLEQEIGYFPKEGILDIKISFIMSSEQREQQLSALREAGIPGYIFKISDDEYIDYGELDSKCTIVLKVKLADVTGYAWRSEEVEFESIATESGKEDGYIEGLMIDTKDEKGLAGYLMFGIASPMAMFDEEDVKQNAKPFERDPTHNLQLVTDSDCTPLIPKPEGYDDWDGTTPNPEFEEYRKVLTSCHTKSLNWKTLFESKNPYLLECLQKYSETLIGTTAVSKDYKVQVRWNEFVGWVDENMSSEKFWSNFEPLMKETIASERRFAIAKEFAAKIKSEETISKLMEFNNDMKLFSEKLYELAKETSVKINADGTIDETSLSSESSPNVAEFTEKLESIRKDMKINDTLTELITLVSLDVGMITPEQAELPKEEIVELEGYNLVAESIKEIVKTFNDETVKKFANPEAIEEITNQ